MSKKDDKDNSSKKGHKPIFRIDRNSRNPLRTREEDSNSSLRKHSPEPHSGFLGR